jgi:hypothetical protein
MSIKNSKAESSILNGARYRKTKDGTLLISRAE